LIPQAKPTDNAVQVQSDTHSTSSLDGKYGFSNLKSNDKILQEIFTVKVERGL
jgi:hypothetical protein